jgi:hypothetical protein
MVMRAKDPDVKIKDLSTERKIEGSSDTPSTPIEI